MKSTISLTSWSTSRWSLLWVMCVVCGLMCVRCLPLEKRACSTSADCDPSTENKHCFEGSCQVQACAPGVIESCFDGEAERATKGICQQGSRLCQTDGQWSRCEGQILPQREICDRRDNDCDGTVDKGPSLQCECQPGKKRECYSGPDGTEGVGSCRKGTQFCELDSLWGPCYAEQVPQVEVCDQLDNNCNGAVDEGLSCTCQPRQKRPCYSGSSSTQYRGVCRGGTQTCDTSGKWGNCVGESLPQPEVCNGLDDDCDGQVDGPVLNCQPTERCVRGKCGCESPHENCNGACVDTTASTQHCGGCGQACPLGAQCVRGGCQCPSGQSLCQGACVNIQTDPGHCGRCTNACPSGTFCRQGACSVCSKKDNVCGNSCCPSPLLCCSNTCLDPSTNKEHCGACDNKCQDGNLCCGGACVVESVVEVVKPANRVAREGVWISRVILNIVVPVEPPAQAGKCAVTRCVSTSRVKRSIAVLAAKRVSLVSRVVVAVVSSHWLPTPNIVELVGMSVGLTPQPAAKVDVSLHLIETPGIAASVGMLVDPMNLVVQVHVPTWFRTLSTVGLVAKLVLQANCVAKGIATLRSVPERSSCFRTSTTRFV